MKYSLKNPDHVYAILGSDDCIDDASDEEDEESVDDVKESDGEIYTLVYNSTSNLREEHMMIKVIFKLVLIFYILKVNLFT